MATVTVDHGAIVTRNRGARCRYHTAAARVGTRSRAYEWGTGPRDQLIIVEAVTETRLAELRSAVIDQPTWTLNGIAPMRFKIAADDPTILDCLTAPSTWFDGTAELALLGYVEAQFWRDGELRWAGPVVVGEPDIDTGTVEFECWDLGFYFTRRFMGAAERKDLLNDSGQFERKGLPGWTPSSGGVTAVRNTTVKRRGVGAAQISGTGSLQASFDHPPQSVGQDLTVLLSLEVRIPEGTPEGTPIATIRSTPAGSSTYYQMTGDNTFATDSDTPLGEWTRITCRTLMRPNTVNRIDCVLWTWGHGNTYADDCRAMRNDTTGIPSPGADLAVHLSAVLNHFNGGRGKSDTRIKFRALGLSGTTEPLGIRHLEHTDITDILDQYAERDDGLDWWIDPTTRTFCVAPRRGKDQTGVTLDSRTVLSGGWTQDETEKASTIVVLGDADGVDRPEGAYSDTSTTNGMVLEHLEPAKNGRTLAALDPTARSIWNEKSQPQTTLRPVVVPGSWWTEHGVQPGDVWPAHLRCGVLRPASSSQGLRVQTIVHDLASDTLELT